MSDTIAFVYGAKAPTMNADRVAEQMRLARMYRNKLIELERDRRAKVEVAVSAFSAAVDAAQKNVAEIEAELAVARESASRKNSEARSRNASASARPAIADIRQRLKDARAKRKEARQAAFADPALRIKLDAIESENLVARKKARAECGVFWGTYLSVEESLRDVRKGAPPEFKRWNGTGKVVVQIQRGMSIDELTAAKDTKVRLSGKDLSLRIGSEGRAPIFATLPISQDRPLPAGGQIMWAWARRERIGCQEHWTAGFTVRGGERKSIPLATSGMVGIDVGWRLVKDGLRVSKWVGSDGRRGELVLPQALLDRRTQSDELRSIRDDNFNRIRDRLAAWIAEHEASDWMREQTKELSKWKSPQRLGSLWWNWKDQRFPGDDEIFPEVQAWRKQDRHLWNWEAHNLRRLSNSRKDIYRVFARRLCEQYAVAFVEDTDWRELAKLKPVEEDRTGEAAMRKHMRSAAVGELIECLKWRFQDGLKKLPAKNTTRTCHACGKITPVNGVSIWHLCECGAAWDIDDNAAENLLASGKVMMGSAGGARGEVVTTTYGVNSPDSGASNVASVVGARGGRFRRRREKELELRL